MKNLLTLFATIFIASLFASCNRSESEPYIYYDAFYTTRNNSGDIYSSPDYYQTFTASATSSMDSVSVSWGYGAATSLDAQDEAKSYFKKDVPAYIPNSSESYAFNIKMANGDTYQKYDIIPANRMVAPALINRSSVTANSDTIFLKWDTIPGNNRDYFNLALEKGSTIYFNLNNGYAIPDTTSQFSISPSNPFWQQGNTEIPSGEYLLTLYTYKVASTTSGGTGIDCLGIDTMTITVP
ncbi:MAG: hypothetical protein ACK5MG_08060 [Bacteroidales bacterium]